jgi:hypothetical protein
MPVQLQIYNFDFVNDTLTRYYLLDAFKAVSKARGWAYLKNYEIPIQKELIESNIVLNEINKYLDQAHTSESYSNIMKHIQYIAKNGYDKYRNFYENSIKPKVIKIKI